VRTGDFVVSLVRSAQDLNEYAFALGAMAHYFADTEGHPLAVNRSVPMLYPKLRRRFGDVIVYEQNPAAHIKTEFGFDVVQVATGHYAPDAYHDFIGFEVSKPVLERAFREVYGLELSSIFTSLDLALGTYRWAVRSLIPATTKAAWELKKDEIVKARPGITRTKFLYNVSRAGYERAWGRQYRRPGIGARILAWFSRLLPHVGPFKALAFRPPTAETERLFMLSFNRTLDGYRAMLARVRRGDFTLAELDLDTGQQTHPGEYRMADAAYAGWLERLQAKDFRETTPAIRTNILGFYSDLNAPFATRRKARDWKRLLAALDKLKALPTS
jgi:hypothetical protein